LGEIAVLVSFIYHGSIISSVANAARRPTRSRQSVLRPIATVVLAAPTPN
jgi:hypothetical protein